MYVMTADQRGSRRRPDAVPGALKALNAAYADDLVLAFDRTAGDEIQALVAESSVVVSAVADLVRRGDWWIGVGVGAVETPVPDNVRAGRGTAFVHARAAVDRAKTQPTGLAVVGDDEPAATRSETTLWLLAGLLMRRSDAGWEAVDAMAGVGRQIDAAARLGITPQAMSRRLRVAGWAEDSRARDLAAWVLEQGEDA
ncbi:SatD family protein [Solicola gregarius]|uniref:SatD family protein n=1 Tax=Solicola gregarius TaxID=2908642 RepID=A0AA46TIE3_9ACTN|nr:SatD family protein [Solicola gregarius]UYM05830.1 SatD family protein [Solicola gregarius]